MANISDNDRELIKKILEKYLPNLQYWVFGSRITGNAKPHSDLDIVIISLEKIDLLTLSTLREEFSLSNLSYKIDLVDWNRIDDEFRSVIKQNYEVL